MARGLTRRAPATKPAWNTWAASVSTPPTKPSLPECDLRAAAAPARKAPCSAANVNEATLGAGTEVSMTPKDVPGKSLATEATGPAKAKPIPKTSP